VILAIDSSAGTSVALVDSSGNTLSTDHSDNPRGHAEVIGNLITGAFRDGGITAADLDQVVMGVGPGPFTGLRVGMAAAQAVAWVHSLPLWPVVSMDAAAWGQPSDVVVWSDQKRGERAWLAYRMEGSLPLADGLPQLHRASDFSEVEARFPDALIIEAPPVDAADLARVAVARKNLGLEFVGADALYLRAPDVTLS